MLAGVAGRVLGYNYPDILTIEFGRKSQSHRKCLGAEKSTLRLVTEAFYLCHVYEKTNVVEKEKTEFQKTHLKEKRDPI